MRSALIREVGAGPEVGDLDELRLQMLEGLVEDFAHGCAPFVL